MDLPRVLFYQAANGTSQHSINFLAGDPSLWTLGRRTDWPVETEMIAIAKSGADIDGLRNE
jgi:hypothetical protein